MVKHISFFFTLEGQLNEIFELKLNWNDQKFKKEVTAGLPKMWPGFSKSWQASWPGFWKHDLGSQKCDLVSEKCYLLSQIVTRFSKNENKWQKIYDKLYDKKVLGILIGDPVKRSEPGFP